MPQIQESCSCGASFSMMVFSGQEHFLSNRHTDFHKAHTACRSPEESTQDLFADRNKLGEDLAKCKDELRGVTNLYNSSVREVDRLKGNLLKCGELRAVFGRESTALEKRMEQIRIYCEDFHSSDSQNIISAILKLARGEE